MQDATRQGKILSFFLMKRNESCARKRGGGEKEWRRGGGGLTFFKGIINSLSALVYHYYYYCITVLVGDLRNECYSFLIATTSPQPHIRNRCSNKYKLSCVRPTCLVVWFFIW